MSTHDDAICLKGLAEGNNQPVEDVRIERCAVSNMAGGSCLEIGYESATPVYQRIIYQDIQVDRIEPYAGGRSLAHP